MSEKWKISRVGKLDLEVGDTPQEAIIRLQILPLPPLAWTDCFLQTELDQLAQKLSKPEYAEAISN
jgi:hypothetical protein